MIKFNNNLNKVHRIKSNYNTSNAIRLHASERDSAFSGSLWSTFINSITSDDITKYPNVDNAYEILSRLVGIDKQNLVISEGSDRILKDVFQCFAINKVLTTDPCFPMYKVYSDIQGISIEQISYTEPSFPFIKFVDSINSSVDLVILSNPSSPVGDSLSDDQIFLIANVCKQHQILLVIDEAYIEFSNAKSALHLVNNYDVIVVRTMSKAYGSAGARIGYAICSNYIKTILTKVSAMNEISGVSIKWMDSLLKHTDEVDSYINQVIEHREMFKIFLKQTKINFIDSQTNYVNIVGALNLNNILVKQSAMPWDNNIYTRVSIPADDKNYIELINAIERSL